MFRPRFLIAILALSFAAFLLLTGRPYPGKDPAKAPAGRSGPDFSANASNPVKPAEKISDEQLQSQLQQALQQLLVKLDAAKTAQRSGAAAEVEAAASGGKVEQQPGSNEIAERRDEAPISLRQQFLQAGVSAGVFEQLQRHVEQNQLSLRELRQQALREGWINSPEYRQKSSISGDPTRGIRAAFGDRVFDLYLFFTHRPNRVLLKTVSANSPAALAGLQAGDIITRYASRNIYSVFGLRRAFEDGEAGDTVLLEFLRNGRALSTTLPRGALDASLQMVRLDPDG